MTSDMKYIYRFILILFAAFGLAACEDDDYIQIDSLSAMGDEFYCNQKVKVWMCVYSSDLWHTDYVWSCDGGTLTQPQGLNEMTWKAPNVPGTYTITCTASIGGKSDTRSHKMYVSQYFFEKFEASTQTSFSLQNAKSSIKTDENGSGYLSVTVNSSTEPVRYIRHSFSDDLLCVPFSTRALLGFDKNMPTTRLITIGSKSANATLEYRWNFRADTSNNGSYINKVSLQWFPTTPSDGFPELDSTSVPSATVEGTTDWNIRLNVQYTSSSGVKTDYYEYHNLDAMDIFENGECHTVALGVDGDYNLMVYIDGSQVLTSSIVYDMRTNMACEGSMFLNNWEIYHLNGNGARNQPQFHLDDCYASNTDMLE
jgi:hypothetical protein